MITLFAWILLIINMTILIVSLVVVFMQKSHDTPPVLTNTHVVSLPYLADQWEDNIDLDNQRTRVMDYIRLRCAEFDVMFEDISSMHACIFRFRGLSKRKESIVYVFHNEDAKDAFMGAIDQLVEDALTPAYGIILVFPFTHECNDEIIAQLNEKKIPIEMIMCDETGISDFFNTERTCAAIGTGKKPFAVYEVENDNEEYDWLGELNPCTLFDAVYSEEAHASVKAVSSLLERKERFMLHFPSLFSAMIINTLTHRYPDTISWFYPIIDKQEKHLIIYAPDRASLKDAMQKTEASAKNKNVSLTLVKKETNKNILPLQDDYYKQWTRIAQNTSAGFAIPQLFEDPHGFPCTCPIVSFAPLYQGRVTSSYEAVQYYLSLLELKDQF